MKLRKLYTYYTITFVLFTLTVGILEWAGVLGRNGIGYAFMTLSVAVYAIIGIINRTSDPAEYYVAGRNVPSVYNGMATGSDWMSAASFISMAGILFVQGYNGLAYIMGWTGGYVLLALLLGPYLRKFGQYTIPDFLGSRFYGNGPRVVGIIAAILVSLTYLVAQLTGVGIIVSRFIHVDYNLGVFLGLAGVLVCSFLGGMKAVTWTQVAQYIILISAYMIPVVTLSVKLFAFPLPEFTYGYLLQRISVMENQINGQTVQTDIPADKLNPKIDPAKEAESRDIWKKRAEATAADLKDPAAALAAKKTALEAKVALLSSPEKIEAAKADLAAKLKGLEGAEAAVVQASLNELASPTSIAAAKEATEKALKGLPATPEAAKEAWEGKLKTEKGQSAPVKNYLALPIDSKTPGTDMLNFLGLIFCLMVGTAGLPHILTRYYTTPSVKQARSSVAWSLFFIFLLYFTAPAYAAFSRYTVLSTLVGSSIDSLPTWVTSWKIVGLFDVVDVNKDGIVQFADFVIKSSDFVVLATPEIAGLPFTITGLVMAGGLAAALSTADGLLLTIANALSHDLYYQIINPQASVKARIAISKTLLLVAAAIAAYLATFRSALIAETVAWAFSFAASSFFPVLVLGVWWKRTTKEGAMAGLAVGLTIAIFYTLGNRFYGVDWLGVKSVASGVFGVPANFLVTIVVSMLTKAPAADIQHLVESVRYPKGAFQGVDPSKAH